MLMSIIRAGLDKLRVEGKKEKTINNVIKQYELRERGMDSFLVWLYSYWIKEHARTNQKSGEKESQREKEKKKERESKEK